MIRYALTRLVSLALSLVVASLVVFTLVEVIPGDPAAFMLGINAQEDTIAALRSELGLDAGPVERYLSWAVGQLTGDFGSSFRYRSQLSEMIGE